MNTNKATYFTEVTDHFSSKPYTHPPTPQPSEFAAKQSAEDLVGRRDYISVKVLNPTGGVVQTYESVRMERR